MTIPSTASPILAAFERAAEGRNATNAAPPSSETQTPSIQTPNQPNIQTTKRPQKVNNVLTILERTKIASWMTKEAITNGPKHIISKAVGNFFILFRSGQKANLMKASRIWRSKFDYVEETGTQQSRDACTTISRTTHIGLKRVNLKARSGRGRKTRQWVRDLHMCMLSEFDRLRKLGVKFTWKTMRALALTIIETSSNTSFNKHTKDDRSQKYIADCIDGRWIQGFMERYRIVSRAHTGKLKLSPQKTEEIHKEVAYHLGVVARAFRSGEWKEEDIENADETHFMINMDNGKTLGFCGEQEVKYCDVVSGGEDMTMVVRISGGPNARIQPAFMVFKNTSRSYPIRGVPDDVPGVSYRTGPKDWMDTTVMPQWLREGRAISALPDNRNRILFVDNCSGHNPTTALQEASQLIRTTLKYFPKNATDLVQPADLFIIQKIKSAWGVRWERFKMEKIAKGEWSASGKVINPGKRFFLKLAADAVRDVNVQRDVDGITYTRKAMIRTGLALNLNGRWEERQLFPALQKIISEHRSHFEGEPVTLN